MTAYDAAHWENFALAQLGASAALLGLMFVALSINLRDFIGTPTLVNRAAESVIGLASVLVASTAVLIPQQSEEAVGVELGVVALVTLGVVARLQRHLGRPVAADRPAPPAISIVLRRTFGLGAPLLLLVAAASLLADAGGGLYWWPAAVIAAYTSRAQQCLGAAHRDPPLTPPVEDPSRLTASAGDERR